MPGRNNDKIKESLKELEKKISPVLVVNNGSLKPYVESFQYFPENVYQQPLGILSGFFEIKEYSEDSAYIVNFLNSVLKKEYYINPKRPVTESLDSALHKVNVALSELAKHGNVNWLGKLDGAVCIFEKNNLHFSVAGDAKVLLYRNQAFNDISEGLASDPADPHPLKTFVNVSSGRLENRDKLLITSDDIFHILTLPQLAKNVQRFSEEKFVQFLRTALSNELEMASVIVVDMAQRKAQSKKAVMAAVPESEEKEPVNVFSREAFSRTQAEPLAAAIEEKQDQPAGQESGYTDKKTGHIYIQGQSDENPEPSPWQAYLGTFKDYAADFAYEAKKQLRRKSVAAKKTLALLRNGMALKLAEIRKARTEKKDSEKLKKEAQEEADLPESAVGTERHIPVMQIEDPSLETIPEAEIPGQFETEPEPVAPSETKPPESERKLTLAEKISAARQELVQEIPIRQTWGIASLLDEDELNIGKKGPSVKKRALEAGSRALSTLSAYKGGTASAGISKTLKDAFSRADFRNLKKAVPDFQKTRQLFGRFSRKQKLAIIAILSAMILFPLLAGKLLGGQKEAPAIEVALPEPTLAETLAKDRHIQLDAKASRLTASSGSASLLLFQDAPYAVTETEVISLSEEKPEGFAIPLAQGEKVSGSAFMQDLGLILILTDKRKVFSFSPVSEQFKENSISIPESALLDFAATYLTYMYLVDPSAGQIYRYPRAEGGFGEKADWLRNSVPLTGISSLTIDDSIYFVKENKINKLFKGQAESIIFENSETPVEYTDIFTTIDLDNLYALDAKNARLITYAKTGEIVKQYFNESLKGATGLVVSEKSGTAYVKTKDGVVKLAL